MPVLCRASLCPPALPEPIPAPAWVLLDKKAYIARRRENATTARAKSSGGDTVEVSFCLAAAPALSYACVHCPDGGFSTEPVVAASAGAFVLLEVRFNFGPRTFFYDSGIRDYFVYSAGGPRAPSLRCLPQFTIEHDIKPCEIGVLPCGEEGFVVAALVPLLDTRDRPARPFDLHLFSSRTGEWRTVAPRLDPYSCERNRHGKSRVFSHETSKVIVVGGGVLGWVDLWRGVLLCDVLADDPVVRLVPLPKPAVGRAWKSNPGMVRDVTGDGNNSLRFVEVQHFPRSPSDDVPLPGAWESDNSDADSDGDDGGPSCGWRVTTWHRALLSPSHDCDDQWWVKDCTVDSADILLSEGAAGESGSLLPEPRTTAEDGTRILKILDGCHAPVLSRHDDGVVHMMCSVNGTHSDREALVAAFDVRKRRLTTLAAFSAQRNYSFDGDTCLPCSFPM